MTRKKLYALRWPLLILLCLLLFVLNIAVGSVSIAPAEIIAVILGNNSDVVKSTIILNARLPEAITASLAGLSLGVSGLLMQTLFRNPMAGPGVLGVTSGSGLMVALLVFLGSGFFLNQNLIVLAAITGAAVVLFIIMVVARRFRDVATVLIVGLMLGFLSSACISILQMFSNDQALRNFVMWGFGSFGGVSLADLPLFAFLVFVGLFFAIALLKQLNSILLGEDYARSLGVNIGTLRILSIAAAGILAGAVTAYCGPIAFLGLATPHLARGLFKTTNHRVILPASAILGIALALACNFAAQMPGFSFSLPLNAINALVGAPVILYLILNARKFRTLI